MATIFCEMETLIDIYDILEIKSEKIKKHVHDKEFQHYLAKEIINNKKKYPNIICKLFNYNEAFDFFNTFCRRISRLYKNNYQKLAKFLLILSNSEVDTFELFINDKLSPLNAFNILINPYKYKLLYHNVNMLAPLLKEYGVPYVFIEMVDELCKEKTYHKPIEDSYSTDIIIFKRIFALTKLLIMVDEVYYEKSIEKLLDYGYFNILEELLVREIDIGNSKNSIHKIYSLENRITLLKDLNYLFLDPDINTYVKNHYIKADYSDTYKYMSYLYHFKSRHMMNKNHFMIFQDSHSINVRDIFFSIMFLRILKYYLKETKNPWDIKFDTNLINPIKLYNKIYEVISIHNEAYYILHEGFDIILELNNLFSYTFDDGQLDILTNICIVNFKKTKFFSKFLQTIDLQEHLLADMNIYDLLTNLSELGSIDYIKHIIEDNESLFGLYYKAGYFDESFEFTETYPNIEKEYTDIISGLPVANPCYLPNSDTPFERITLVKWIMDNETNPLTNEILTYEDFETYNSQEDIIEKRNRLIDKIYK